MRGAFATAIAVPLIVLLAEFKKLIPLNWSTIALPVEGNKKTLGFLGAS